MQSVIFLFTRMRVGTTRPMSPVLTERFRGGKMRLASFDLDWLECFFIVCLIFFKWGIKFCLKVKKETMLNTSKPLVNN